MYKGAMQLSTMRTLLRDIQAEDPLKIRAIERAVGYSREGIKNSLSRDDWEPKTGKYFAMVRVLSHYQKTGEIVHADKLASEAA